MTAYYGLSREEKLKQAEVALKQSEVALKRSEVTLKHPGVTLKRPGIFNSGLRILKMVGELADGSARADIQRSSRIGQARDGRALSAARV